MSFSTLFFCYFFVLSLCFFFFFFFNDTATTEIYTLSLHDALPISSPGFPGSFRLAGSIQPAACGPRSEEHTSELQSRLHLVCRLLLEKKKKNKKQIANYQPSQQNSAHHSILHS